jgi:hypothetical protein
LLISGSAFISPYIVNYIKPLSTNLLMSSGDNDRSEGVETTCNNSFFDNDDDDSAAFEADFLSDFKNNINDGCRGFSSLSWECKDLHRGIKFDLGFMDSMERNLALEMLRDKLEIRRGMRGEDPNICRVFRKLTRGERRSDLTRVKERLRTLRESNNPQSPCKHKKEPVRRVSKLRKPIKHTLLSGKNVERKALRPLRPKNVY